MRSGCSSSSIYWVLLVSGRFCVSKTIIPEAPEHFLTSSARRDTHLFGGLGLRRRFFSLAGRLTRSARRLTLHLPQGWPWENQFSRALARFRALPLPS